MWCSISRIGLKLFHLGEVKEKEWNGGGGETWGKITVSTFSFSASENDQLAVCTIFIWIQYDVWLSFVLYYLPFRARVRHSSLLTTNTCFPRASMIDYSWSDSSIWIFICVYETSDYHLIICGASAICAFGTCCWRFHLKMVDSIHLLSRLETISKNHHWRWTHTALAGDYWPLVSGEWRIIYGFSSRSASHIT